MANTTTFPLASETKTWSPARKVVAAVAGSLLVAICAHVSVPLFFTPVPMTLQPFAVLLLGLFLEPSLAFSALALYLMEGAAGLPVFTPQGLGGMAQLLGPTGGYLMSYPAVAFVVSSLYRRMRVANSAAGFGTGLLAAAAGNALILTMGAAWLVFAWHQKLGHVVSFSVVPFLPGDALKVCAAAAISSGWMRMRKMGEAR